MVDLSRRGFLAVGAAGAALLAGCGDVSDPGVPPLPGGGTTATASPVRRATWRVQGEPLVPATGSGALDGTTVAVTDLFAVAGQKIGAGNPQWLAEAATEPNNAEAVARLLGAGASVAGLAQTDDLGYGHSGVNDHYGTPPNNAAAQRIPGGSTSGAASAVAGGEASIGLGADTGGSVRIPAAYQGLFGFVATRGAVPTAGLLPLSPTLDTVGWLAADVAALEKAVTASVARAPTRQLARAVTAPGINAIATGAVLAATTTALTAWRKSDLPPLTDRDFDIAAMPDWYDAVSTVVAFEAWKQHSPFVSGAMSALGGEARENLATASRTSEEAYRRALTQLDIATAAIRGYLGDTVLVLPTTASPAPERSGGDISGETYANTMRSTGMLLSIATIAGLPAATVPLKSADKVPVGLCLVGPAGRDLDLLALARRVQGSGFVR
ncbi:amidase [Rhodococcus spelaei]|uniref:Amidase n=1 Tax=Rhodococcus spelaei TaxID=2546320 RepID=A0A541AZV3_9NOCA|nr:amidase family protein [Rhodococcus spelaei]TQF65582.1 amidase [Rhodococcus spelaei]